MIRHVSAVAAVLAVALAAPLAVRADPQYYTPPTLLTRGTTTVANAGAGTVVVQVMVNKDGTFKVVRVVRSSNPGNNAAALAIAKSSTYKPAMRGTAKESAFYDYTLRFTASGVGAGDAKDSSSTGTSSDVDRYARMVRAGNYSGAASALTSYLASHPGDTAAELQLGIASTFQNDSATAADAFSKAGDIPAADKSVAVKAYSTAATAAITAKDYPKAVDSAQRAVTLLPNVYTYNTLGFAQLSAGSNADAAATLEKARALGSRDSSVKPKDRAQIDSNLAAAYVASGQVEKAKSIATEAATLDPSQAGASNVVGNYYVKQAQTAVDAGQTDQGAALFDQAAAAIPAQAGDLYARAAFAYLSTKAKPDNDKALAQAQKAVGASPDNAAANFAMGVALANQGKSKDALVALNKADASAKAGSDTKLTASIENAIKQLGSSK